MLTWFARSRPWLALAGAVLILGVLLPPVGSLARQYVFAESLQFVVWAVAAPALLVLGAPWRVVGLSRGAGVGGKAAPAGLADRVAGARSGRPGGYRAAALLATFIAAAIVWRLPVTVNALAANAWLTAPELATLVVAGSGLWLELVESPPLTPRLSRPQRAALAALAMWTVWVLAYIMGLSHGVWFAGYGQQAGRSLSTAADQQIATGILWAVPALSFPPVIYGVLMSWLRNSDDPDEELRRVSAAAQARAGSGGWPRPPRGWRSPSA